MEAMKVKNRREVEKKRTEKIDWWDQDHIAGGYVGG